MYPQTQTFQSSLTKFFNLLTLCPRNIFFTRNRWAVYGGDLTYYSGVKTFYQRVISCNCVTRVLSLLHPLKSMSESIHSNGRNDLDQRLRLILSALGYQSKNGSNFSEAKCVLKMSFFGKNKQTNQQQQNPFFKPAPRHSCLQISLMDTNTLSTDLETYSKHIKLVDMNQQQKDPQTLKLSVTI